MSYQKTLDLMKSMRLHGMHDALHGLQESKKLSGLSADQLMALLLQQEWDEKPLRDEMNNA